MNTTIQFVDLIKSTKAKIEAVIYKTMSAGSVIALCCNIKFFLAEVEIKKVVYEGYEF